jgi:hypothetical protein
LDKEEATGELRWLLTARAVAVGAGSAGSWGFREPASSVAVVTEAGAETGGGLAMGEQVEAAAATNSASTPAMTAAEAYEAAAAEGLTLVPAENAAGFRGVSRHGGRFQARVMEAGSERNRSLGTFASAEEAALCFARRFGPDASATASEAAASASATETTAAEAYEAAAAEGLSLVPAENAAGFRGV